MIVVDSSALLEVLLETQAAALVSERIFAPGETLHAPHLIDLEVAHVLRRDALFRALSPERGSLALEYLAELRLTRHSHVSLLPRIWELRNNVTAYDAAYIALAEALDAPLVTRDKALAAWRGHRAKVELL